MRGVELVNADIYGEVENVTINGVDIAPLIDAELNKRYPLRRVRVPRRLDGCLAGRSHSAGRGTGLAAVP
jgi:hypothetical protein